VSREAFEKWISQPPYEKDITKYPDDPELAAWPKCYRDISVQLAWDAWQAAKADAIPEGYVLVPVEATEAMQFSSYLGPKGPDWPTRRLVYKGMLSAVHNPDLSTKPNQ